MLDKAGMLIGAGIGCLISAAFSSFVFSPMAQEEIEEICSDGDLPTSKAIETYVKYGAAPAVLAGVGIALIVGGNHMNVEKGMAAMAAYTLSDTAFKEYQKKTKELVGEKKEQKIRDEIASDTLKRNPVNGKEIIITGNGSYLCFDKMSGRYFRSDIEKLKRIENALDRRMLDQTYITQNELYLEIGIGPVKNGDNIGWNISNGYIQMSFSYDGGINGEPCLVMDCATPRPI